MTVPFKPEMGELKPDHVPLSESAQIEPGRHDYTLVDLAKSYVLFTHAIMLRYSGMTVDPLCEAWTRLKLPGQPNEFMFDKPLFSGLEIPGDNSWNHRLIGVSHEVWPRVLAALSVVSTLWRDARYYASCSPQRFHIFDYIAASRLTTVPNPRPSVEIWSFSMDTTQGLFGFRPADMTADIPGLAVCVNLGVQAHTLEVANYMLDGDGSGDIPRLVPKEQIRRTLGDLPRGD